MIDWAKLTALAAIAAAILAVGAGLDHYWFAAPAIAKLNTLEGQVKQASDDAKAAAAKQKENQDAQTKQSGRAYADMSARLNAALARLRSQPAGNSHQPMPPVADSTARVDRVIEQSFGSCEGTGSDPCTVERWFFDNALKDAARLDGYDDWVKRIGFPVE